MPTATDEIVRNLIRENDVLRQRVAYLEGFSRTLSAALSKIREVARRGAIPSAKGLMALCDVAIDNAVNEGFAKRNGVDRAMPKGLILPPSYAPGHIQRQRSGR